MNKKLFRKLAVQNIKANRTTFLPFILCTITMVGMFYMLNAISYQVNINRFSGSTTMRTILEFGKSVCGIFSFFVILYTNSFVMKRRAKELGLYSMLGMNKRHIGKVVFWELGISGGISIVSGLGLGMLFSKFMFLLLEAMLDLNTGIKFTIVAEPIFSTLALFVGIFALGIIFNFIRVLRLKPIELMRSTRTGEVEPKTKWIMAIAGVVCLGIGYYMAVTIENPVTAISLFFVAALLVIAGTYFTFVSVSIVILKALKKNKKFFYNKKHFITVSGLIYRMKQNAVGLANICVLSTAVLVIMFSTVALYIGSEDAIASQYPIDTDIGFYWHEEDFDKGASIFDEKVIGEIVSNRAKKYNVQVKDVQYGFSYISTGVAKGNEFESVSFFNDNIAMTDLITVDNYNRITGENITLEDDEVLMSTKLDDFDAEKEMIYNGKKYKVKGKMKELAFDDNFANLVQGYIHMVVKDESIFKEMCKYENEKFGTTYSVHYDYQFNLEGEEADKLNFCRGLRDELSKTTIPGLGSVDSIYTSRDDYINSYGSLFFIGIFIGSMFLVTTVMIIYYKQISEGYDDREKFVIMRKVGMSDKEIKATIKNQILLVFFLPIILAVVHISFAFPVIKKILYLFGLFNTSLLIGCMIATVIIFVIAYAIVYMITARTYYNCVTGAN